jgi:predicted NBD/HSP70 family sugar kinase
MPERDHLKGQVMLMTGDQQLVKQMNRMALVRTLCREPELSRADLAEKIGLTKSTVSLLVRELADEGWLRESEILTTGSLGRRPTPLHVDPSRLVLLGADLNIDEARVVATSLLGEVIDRIVVPYEDVSDASSCLRLVARALIKLARRLAVKGRGVKGVGIGLHGGVEESTGVLHFAPNLGWRKVDAAAQMRQYLVDSPLDGLPLFIQNEADVAALAEFEFIEQSGADPLIYLSIGHGVGAGVFVRDRLLTGYRGLAGEVGHTTLQVGGPRCLCGRRGCVDALMGFGALLGERATTDPARRTAAVAALFDRVTAGHAASCEAVSLAGSYLGILLNNLWVAFDPMRIVLGGPALRFGQTLLKPALRVLDEYAQAAQMPAPQIQQAHYGVESVAVGAAALVRYHLTRPLSQLNPNDNLNR